MCSCDPSHDACIKDLCNCCGRGMKGEKPACNHGAKFAVDCDICRPGTMSWDKVLDCLNAYLPHLAPLFADGWSRWPSQRVSRDLISALQRKADLFRSLGSPISYEDCRLAVETLVYHAKRAQ